MREFKWSLVLTKLWIAFWIVVLVGGCAGRSPWCGSGSNAKHCSAQYRHDYYTLVYAPEPLTDVEARNLLRAAVYAHRNGW